MTDAYSYIRFSTTEQAQGDSLRRQSEAIGRFVAENNLVMQKSEAFRDLGVSSFRGANLKQGLGKFIAEVDAGKVRRGSYLIVESIDRLSRQRVFDSLNLLVSLVDKGIKVVTLNDSAIQVLDKDAGFPALVMTMGSMFNAHEESAKKSTRLKAVWKKKKANAANEPISSRCPEWLTYSKETKKFTPVPSRVATVQKIFELADDGIGRHRIVKFLNNNRHESFRNAANGWQGSSVAKLLNNRALIGFYQPHATSFDPETGKKARVVDGEEVFYYPPVIDADLFRRVSTREHTRAVPLLGRQGPSLTNLFSGMVLCKWCGGPMSMSNKGPTIKGGRYLVCANARRGKGCAFRSWRYDDVERLILVKLLRDVDFADVMGGDSAADALKTIRNEFAAMVVQLESSTLVLNNINKSCEAANWDVSPTTLKRIKDEELKIEGLKAEINLLRDREFAAAQREEDPKTYAARLLELYDHMESADAEQNYVTRVKLRARLAVVVEKIELRPLARGEPPMVNGVPRPKAIYITFRNGMRRVIVPVGDDVFSVDSSESVASVTPA